jgi:hypothetical protein
VFKDWCDAGLRFWLVFLIAFVAIQYPAELAILMSFLAAAAGGALVAFWKAKDQSIEPLVNSRWISPFSTARQKLSQWRQERREFNQRRARSPRSLYLQRRQRRRSR